MHPKVQFGTNTNNDMREALSVVGNLYLDKDMSSGC